MREIKFRAWDAENKEMLKVQELDFEDTFYGGRLSIRTDQYNDYFDMEDMILMQYTGLKDKNEKEIYEGDVVKFDYRQDENFEIVFEDGAFWIRSKYNEYVSLHEVIEICKRPNNWQIEVIGNIYDNPELLEKG